MDNSENGVPPDTKVGLHIVDGFPSDAIIQGAGQGVARRDGPGGRRVFTNRKLSMGGGEDLSTWEPA